MYLVFHNTLVIGFDNRVFVESEETNFGHQVSLRCNTPYCSSEKCKLGIDLDKSLVFKGFRLVALLLYFLF